MTTRTQTRPTKPALHHVVFTLNTDGTGHLQVTHVPGNQLRTAVPFSYEIIKTSDKLVELHLTSLNEVVSLPKPTNGVIRMTTPYVSLFDTLAAKHAVRNVKAGNRLPAGILPPAHSDEDAASQAAAQDDEEYVDVGVDIDTLATETDGIPAITIIEKAQPSDFSAYAYKQILDQDLPIQSIFDHAPRNQNGLITWNQVRAYLEQIGN